MDGQNTSAKEAAAPDEQDPPLAAAAGEAAATGEIPLPSAAGMLVLTAVIGAASKVAGVVIAPGMAGIASQRAVEGVELVSATLAYVFALLLLALICAGSYALARQHRIGMFSRGAVVALSGLVIALSCPSFVQHLHPIPAFALGIIASTIVMVAAIATLRAAHTRIIGAVLGMFALSGVIRPIAAQLANLASDNASIGLYNAGRAFASIALVVQALGTLLAAAWLGTRSRVRGRLLSNGAIVVAFALTYVAARDGGDTPSTLQAVLHGSLAQANGLVLPFGLTSIAAFLVPATILLALVAILQRSNALEVLAVLALALLSQGALDVPLQALAAAAAAQWGMLAMADERTMWSSLVRGRQRAGV